ncbi:MAG TPA: hypothetical protein VGQ76_09515 [Thermoanaerobaculia bacterium]|jgi:hypothetical protein|nr:hypothetical protein [Thermoanaerobaculia bacterium]
MRDGKRIAVWLVALVILVFAGDRIGAFLCSRVLTASQFRFSRVYRGGSNADILVIGDSRGVHSFYAPSIETLTGRPALNLSFNAMSMPIVEALLTDYLERNRAPRLVIIEVTCVVVDRGLVSELRTYAGLSHRLHAVYAREHPQAAAAGRVFHLLPYDSEFFLRALAYLRRSDQDWINRGVIPPELAANARGGWSPRPYPENLVVLRRLVPMLRARGIDVKLVIAPYHPSVGVDMGQILPGIDGPVSNYANAIQESQYFADGVHMNADGSEVFLRMLQRDGVLPSTRE